MKKRYHKTGISKKLVPVRCKGFRVGGKIKYAPNHQELALTDPHHIDWPQCNACYIEARNIETKKQYALMKILKRPKRLKDQNTIVKYLDKLLIQCMNDTIMHPVIAELHRNAYDDYVILLKEYYK